MVSSYIPWGKIEGDSQIIPISANKEISIRKDGNSVLIKVVEEDSETYYHRFIVPESDDIYILPTLPNLPIIIKSVSDLSILPKRKLSAFVEVPLFLSIYSGNRNKKDLLYELTLKSLSKSFFGDPESGEVSYSLASELYTSYEKYKVNNSSVYCKISITNKTTTIMNFERLILRVPNFSLYEGSGIYFSSPQSTHFIGKDVGNQMYIKKEPPLTGFPLKQIWEPRETVDSSLLRKSFYFIKNIYNT